MLAVTGDEFAGWLAFVVLILGSAGIIPLVGLWLRRRLPDRRGLPRAVPPLRLGDSPKTRRSPRHAVAAHRTFLTGISLTGISLVLLPFVAALGVLDLSGLLVAIAFVGPSLLIALHSRRRNPRGGPTA
jgi:hypothetical protein